MLDEAGFEDCKIVISNSLDEYLIEDMLAQGACIDSFGVGERLITAKSEPVFGGVYKLAAVEKDGVIIPKMKISENVEKITNPGAKKVYRLYDRETDRAMADVIALMDEEIPEEDGYTIFDPDNVWKKKNLKDFYAKELLVQIFKEGECVYKSPDIKDIKAYCAEQVEHLWEEVRRFENPQTYYVDLSTKLWEMKRGILEQHT